MLSMLYVRLTIKVKVGMPKSLKVGGYPHKITASSHLKGLKARLELFFFNIIYIERFLSFCKALVSISKNKR